eukprot:11517-Prymnesium_polylepis.1
MAGTEAALRPRPVHCKLGPRLVLQARLNLRNARPGQRRGREHRLHLSQHPPPTLIEGQPCSPRRAGLVRNDEPPRAELLLLGTAQRRAERAARARQRRSSVAGRQPDGNQAHGAVAKAAVQRCGPKPSPRRTRSGRLGLHPVAVGHARRRRWRRRRWRRRRDVGIRQGDEKWEQIWPAQRGGLGLRRWLARVALRARAHHAPLRLAEE